MTLTFNSAFIPRDLSMPVTYGRKRRRTNGGSSSLARIANAVASRVKTAASRTRTATRTKRMYDSGPITEQYDAARRYQRRPMPRRKRRLWRSFTKRVQHVMLQSQALMSYTRDLVSNETWAINKQGTFGYYLGGTTFTDNDELLQAFRNAYGSALTSTTVDDYKLFIKAMSLDIQITNTGTQSCVVDVYTCLARKASNAGGQSIGSQYIALYGEQNSGQVVGPSWNEPSSTPFQNSLWCGYWKILQKKEILLGPGNTTTMQLRLPYNRMMYGKLLEYNLSYLPGITRAYLFQVRGVPRDNAGTAELAAGQVTIGRQWTVTYGLPPGNTRAQASDVV